MREVSGGIVDDKVQHCDIEAPSAGLALHERFARYVPPFWDPRALAAFVNRYGTRCRGS
jgi:hypothetical protein